MSRFFLALFLPALLAAILFAASPSPSLATAAAGSPVTTDSSSAAVRAPEDTGAATSNAAANDYGVTTSASSAPASTPASTPDQPAPGKSPAIADSTSLRMPQTAADDVSEPLITNVQPPDGSIIKSSWIMFSADYSDETGGSGIDPESFMVHIDDRMIMEGCEASTTHGSCPKSGLSNGRHMLQIFICDYAGNCPVSETYFTVDTVRPVVTPLSPSPTSTINSTSATISASFSDVAGSGINSASTVVTIDGADASGICAISTAGVNCQATNLANGLHGVHVAVADLAGNYSTTGDWSFTVSTAAIGVSGQTPAAGSWQTSATPEISVDFQAASSGVITNGTTTMCLDGVDVSASASVATSSVRYVPAAALAEGAHHVSVTVLDDAGHAGSGDWVFNIDTLAPLISGETPTGATTNGQPVISAVFSDSGSGIDTDSVRLLVDGVDETSEASIGVAGATYTPSGNGILAPGTHSAQVSTADLAGNQSTSAWSFSVPASAAVRRVTNQPGGGNASVSMTWYEPLMTTYTSAGTWVVSGFQVSLNSYYLFWYDSGPEGSTAGQLTIKNEGAGEANVGVFIGGQEKWRGNIAEGGKEMQRFPGVSGGPLKVVCPTGQELAVSLRSSDDSSPPMDALPEDYLDTVWLLPWYETKTDASGDTASLVIDNAGADAATVEIRGGDPSRPESLLQSLTIQPGVGAITELPGAGAGVVRVLSTNGQPLLAGRIIRHRDASSLGLALGLAHIDNRYRFDRYSGDVTDAGGGDQIMVGNPGKHDARVEINIGDERLSDPQNPGEDAITIPPGEVRALNFPGRSGPARVECASCSFGGGIVTSLRSFSKNGVSETVAGTGLEPKRQEDQPDLARVMAAGPITSPFLLHSANADPASREFFAQNQRLRESFHGTKSK